MIAVTIGAVFGFVVGLTSVGSGTFFGLVMVLVYPLTIPKIIGTDIFLGGISLAAWGVYELRSRRDAERGRLVTDLSLP